MDRSPTCSRSIAVSALCSILALAPFAHAGVNRWTPLGPLGKNASIVVVDPGTPATLYAATRGGGVFKSTDGGASWSPSSDGITHGDVRDLVIDPETPSRLYAATSVGAFKSTDGAATWTAVAGGLPRAQEIQALALEPDNPAVIWAATDARGLFKSTDFGASWAPRSPARQEVFDVAVDPSTPSTVYAAAYDGIFKSTDGGLTWTPISEGASVIDRFKELAIDPATPTTVYALHYFSGGLFKSTDGGVSWVKKGFAGNTLAVDPRAPSVLFGGGFEGFSKSTDGGESWTPVGGGLPAVNGRVTFDPAAPEVLHAATKDGVYRSADRGETWSSANDGILSVPIVALAVDPRDPATLYASVASGERLLKSTDRGANWTPAARRLPPDFSPSIILVDPVTPTTLYVFRAASCADDARPFKSTDGGASWSELSDDLLEGIVAAALDPLTPANLYALTGQTLVASRDGGESWELLSHVTHTCDSFLAIDPRTPTRLYAAGGGGVLRSVDGGRSWTVHALGDLQAGPIVDLAIDPATPSTLYVSTRRGEVYKSVDGAGSWSKASAGLPGHDFVLDVPPAIDSRAPSHLYLGGSRGAFRSRDGGATWSPFSEGLTHPSVQHLVVADDDPPRLYAGTPGGVFAIEVVDEPDVLELHGGRFRVEVDWRDFTGHTGRGRPVRFSPQASSGGSGIFYFFSADNWELLVKVLDGCALNDRFWVFAAATTNVEYALTVTDTAAGVAKTYLNPLGVSAAAVTDTGAFATCGR